MLLAIISKNNEDDKNQKKEVYYNKDSFFDCKAILAMISYNIWSAASNPMLFIPSNSLLLGIWVSLVKVFIADFRLVLYLSMTSFTSIYSSQPLL